MRIHNLLKKTSIISLDKKFLILYVNFEFISLHSQEKSMRGIKVSSAKGGGKYIYSLNKGEVDSRLM